MPKKKRDRKHLAIEQQVAKIVRFFETHEWASPIAMPLNLHKDLDVMTERYLFDCYTDRRRAIENYSLGNIDEAKKKLTYSIVWWAEACDASCHYGISDFSSLLINKTDNMLNDAIETVFSDQCPSRKLNPIGFSDFRATLQSSVDY